MAAQMVETMVVGMAYLWAESKVVKMVVKKVGMMDS